MERLSATNAYFIELGSYSEFCVTEGVLRVAHSIISHEGCVSGEWADIRHLLEEQIGAPEAPSRIVDQMRIFYDASPQDLFVTVHDGLLYWCKSHIGVEAQESSRVRRTIDGWHCKSIGGQPLRIDGLAYRFIRGQGSRDPISPVGSLRYLMSSINDELSPPLVAADTARTQYVEAIEKLITLLTWKEFERLVILLLSIGGWHQLAVLRQGEMAVVHKLQNRTTAETAILEITAKAGHGAVAGLLYGLENGLSGYDRLFLAWHKGETKLPAGATSAVFLNNSHLARLAIEHGLGDWIQYKVAEPHDPRGVPKI